MNNQSEFFHRRLWYLNHELRWNIELTSVQWLLEQGIKDKNIKVMKEKKEKRFYRFNSHCINI